jgi:hypothetical protein
MNVNRIKLVVRYVNCLFMRPGGWPDLRKNNEYTYVGEPIPKVTREQHADFIINYQKSILYALVEKRLITPTQCEKCIEELEYQRR